ncbi:MAG: universal stress protein [Rhodothermales bacterium]
MRILFATNLTEPADVTRSVERFARGLDAELFVLHVISPAPTAAMTSIDPMTGLSGFAPYTLYDPQLEADMEEAEENAFKTFLLERFSMPVHAGLRKGDPADAILDDAEDRDVDLVMLAKRRHGRLETLLVGSTVRDVLKRAVRPTLVLPVPSEEEDGS